MKRARAAAVVGFLSCLAAAPASGSPSALRVAASPAPVSIKAVLTAIGGQSFTEEVRNRPVGPGPEMTEGDITERNPPSGFTFCGTVVADLNPDDYALTIGDTANNNSCGYASIVVHLQDPDMVKLETISDNYAGSGGSKAQITGQPGDWTITWENAILYDNQMSVFTYAEAPQAFAPGPLTLQTAPVPHLRGHTMSIDVDGFTPGESYQVKISGVVVGHGTADANGQIHRKVRVPLLAHRPKAKLLVKGSEHRVHKLIRIRNGIARQ